jgi:hypothetical protein
MISYNVFAAILLLGLFEVLLRTGIIASHNFAGSRFTADHAYLVVLLLFPALNGWWLAISIVVWSLGMWAYIDDFYQHIRLKTDPYYASPLHRFGVRIRLYRFRDWLATKKGFGWLAKL